MNFNKDKYQVVKNIISKETAKFVSGYFLLKREVVKTFLKTTYIPKANEDWGTFNDGQIPDTYSNYADIAMETLLQWVQPAMEKHTKLKLIPTYSYARIYKKGDVLHRHKDRFSCQVSTTLNLGGDPWPIYLNPNPKEGYDDYKLEKYVPSKSKGIKINLSVGDMLIYQGMELEHWRESFEGKDCIQVFLHYNKLSKKAEINKFDQRPHLGLPGFFKNIKNV